MDDLTQKQRTICDMLSRGMANKEIAKELGISARTVEAHRGAIYRKMGVKNVMQLVRKVVEGENAQ